MAHKNRYQHTHKLKHALTHRERKNKYKKFARHPANPRGHLRCRESVVHRQRDAGIVAEFDRFNRFHFQAFEVNLFELTERETPNVIHCTCDNFCVNLLVPSQKICVEIHLFHLSVVVDVVVENSDKLPPSPTVDAGLSFHLCLSIRLVAAHSHKVYHIWDIIIHHRRTRTTNKNL